MRRTVGIEKIFQIIWNNENEYSNASKNYMISHFVNISIIAVREYGLR